MSNEPNERPEATGRTCSVCKAGVAAWPKAMVCHCYEMPWILDEAQATELADLKRKLAGMEEALRDCVEYIEPMADADFIAGSYTGNTEMRLSVRARAALELGK